MVLVQSVDKAVVVHVLVFVTMHSPVDWRSAHVMGVRPKRAKAGTYLLYLFID